MTSAPSLLPIRDSPAWNPLTHLVNAYRAVLLHGALPEWPALLVVGAVALGLLSLGYWLFLHMTSRFVEEL